MSKLTHTNGQDRWIHRWIDRSVGRWIFCIVSFYFTNCPTPPSLGSALHGQHPHNSVYAIYLSVSTQTAFNLFLLPLHMSVDTPTFIHAHTDLSCISYYPKRKMCSQRLQPLSCILSSFPPPFSYPSVLILRTTSLSDEIHSTKLTLSKNCKTPSNPAHRTAPQTRHIERRTPHVSSHSMLKLLETHPSPKAPFPMGRIYYAQTIYLI